MESGRESIWLLLGAELSSDWIPCKTWRSLLIRVDEYGKLVWQNVDNFVKEKEDEVITTASEYVITSEEGKITSVLNLAFGFGLQLYELK